MTLNNLEVSDKEMVDRWQMHTEFMLNKVSASDLKRMVDDIRDGINYHVNKEGNIEEVELSPIERDLEELTDRYVEKVESVKEPEQIIEDEISDLRQRLNLPGAPASEKTEAKLKVLKKIKKEIVNG